MNTIMGMLNKANPAMNMIGQMMGMIRAAGNPQAALTQMMGNNPQMAQVMQIVQQNGGDAKAAFYKMAEQKGVNPEEIISQVKQMMG